MTYKRVTRSTQRTNKRNGSGSDVEATHRSISESQLQHATNASSLALEVESSDSEADSFLEHQLNGSNGVISPATNDPENNDIDHHNEAPDSEEDAPIITDNFPLGGDEDDENEDMPLVRKSTNSNQQLTNRTTRKRGKSCDEEVASRSVNKKAKGTTAEPSKTVNKEAGPLGAKALNKLNDTLHVRTTTSVPIQQGALCDKNQVTAHAEVALPRVSIGSESVQITMLRNEIATLRSVISNLPQVITSFIDSRFNDNRTLHNGTKEALAEIRAVLNLVMVDRKQKKDTQKSKDIDLPFFDFVFSDEMMQVVVEKCTISHVTSTSKDYLIRNEKNISHASVLARGAALALRIILFAVNQKNKESRSMYKTDVGHKFSEFRETIVLSSLHAAKNNKFKMFRDSVENAEEDVAHEADMKSKKVRIPKWLQGNFISKDHIAQARIRSEETLPTGRCSHGKSGFKEEKIGEDHEWDAAIFASTQLYKRFTQKLNSARMMAKSGFFDEVGYLFVDWKASGCAADQSTIKIRWLNSVQGDLPNIDSIPDATPRITTKKDKGSDDDELAKVNRNNKKLLRDLMSQCGCMILEVEHEVCIRKHAKKINDKVVKKEKDYESQDTGCLSSNSGPEEHKVEVVEQFERKDTLIYHVNLIGVACRFLSGYTSQLQYASPASFLCASADSLRCVYSVSLLLKELLDKVIPGYKRNCLDARVNGLSLAALLPSPARQKTGLLTKCVHMFETLFNSRSVNSKGNVEVIDNGSAGVGDGTGERNAMVIEIE